MFSVFSGELALIGKWTIIDANRPAEEVGMEIRKLLRFS
jgi:hypothetical protein